ncbi:MAG: TonB-dependent receptor [Muribaculaceae bacterium]|nr:TonB-dependent receptor [Muribaculaceae bacterium]
MKRKLISVAISMAFATIAVHSQNVTLHVYNKSAEVIFADIMQQTSKNFIYPSDILTGLNVTVNADDLPLTVVLDNMFKGTGITYKIIGNNITLRNLKAKSVVKYTISGFVKEAVNEEAIVGATVYDLNSGKGTVTNANGFFSLTLAAGEVDLKVQYVGFDPYVSGNFKLTKNKILNVTLSEPKELDEVVVNATVNNTKAMVSTEIGSLNLTPAAIKATPVIFGESDVVKTLQLEPGVSAGIEGMAGMYVHGGDTDENLYMLDNIPLYQVNHFGGLFSAFNTEALRNVDFYKTTFPSKYDGRLSSFMDVHTKDGSLKEHHGSFRLGITSGAFDINGPIIKDRTSYSLAIRRSWYDALTAPALAIMNKLNDSYNTHFRYAFTDINAKINHHFSDRSSAYLMFYYGEDYLYAGEDDKGKDNYAHFYLTSWEQNDATSSSDEGKDNSYTDNRSRLIWGNIVASSGWRYVFSPKLFGEFTGAFSRYFSSLRNKKEDYSITDDVINSFTKTSFRHQNNINDLIARADFNCLLIPENKLDFGASYTYHSFLPYRGIQTMTKENGILTAYDNIPSYKANELNFYLSDDYSLGNWLRVNGGLHFSMFMIDGKTQSHLSPRFSLRITPGYNLALKAGYSRSVQYIHQIAESNISLPTDQWIPISGNQKPQTADKVAIGAYWSTQDRQYTFSVEGYYKWMHNLIEYTDDYYLVPPSASLTEKLGVGEGKARGIDFKLTKEFGKFTGHISYSLLWVDRCFPDKNKGNWFPARFDNRHKINISLAWKINSKWDVSASWTGMSGNRITLPLQCWNDPGLGPWHFDMNYFDKTNNYRLPFYHRLDLSAIRRTNNGYWTFSIYNAYSYMNVIAVRRDVTDNPKPGRPDEVFQYIRAIPIIPSVSYTWLF